MLQGQAQHSLQLTGVHEDCPTDSGDGCFALRIIHSKEVAKVCHIQWRPHIQSLRHVNECVWE